MVSPVSPQDFSMSAIDCWEMVQGGRELGWDVDYQQIDRGPFNSTFDGVAVENLSVVREHYNRGLMMCGTPPPDTFAVILNCGKGSRGFYQGKSIEQDQLLFMRPGDEGHLRVPASCYSLTVSVREDVLAEALWRFDRGSLSGCIRSNGAVSVPSDVFRSLTEVLMALTSGENHDGHRGLQDRLLHLVSRAALGGSTAADEPRRLTNRNRCVRKAREFIESHLGNDITVSEVASASGVSVRSLQSAFLDVLGVKPAEYVRLRRLSRARIDLLNRHRREESVGRIAHAHGLRHLGFFSRDYQKLFGELPSQTRTTRGPIPT